MKFTEVNRIANLLLVLLLCFVSKGNTKSPLKTSLYRKLKLSMIHLKKQKKQPDRKLFADLIAKAIMDAGIKAYPEFKYKNVLGGNMNIILPKSRPFMVYNTYPIIQSKVDTNNNYLHLPLLSNVPRINV